MNACFQLEYRRSPSGETGSMQYTKFMVKYLFDSKNICRNGVCVYCLAYLFIFFTPKCDNTKDGVRRMWITRTDGMLNKMWSKFKWFTIFFIWAIAIVVVAVLLVSFLSIKMDSVFSVWKIGYISQWKCSLVFISFLFC